MTTQTTDPQDRPEIQTTEDLLAAVRMGMEIATRADISQSERRVIERIGERFDAQDKRIDERFDAQGARMDGEYKRIDERFDAQDARMDSRFDSQDARFDSQDARMDSQDARLDDQGARLDKNTIAIMELKASIDADRRNRTRILQWAAAIIGGLGALAAILTFAAAVFGN